MGFLVSRFFPPSVVIIATVFILVIMILLSKKIQAFYLRIEDRFLANYYEKDNEENNVEDLSPWDAHMETFEVQPEWDGIGKSLKNLRLRENYEINVARIDRGTKIINTPKAEELVYPFDILTVIGTDEQLDRFRKEVELSPAISETKGREVTLWHYKVKDSSVLINRSIRDSGIRERTRGIVVGVETAGKRIINPDSGYVILPGDVIWIVGERLRLLSIRKAEKELENKSEFPNESA
jgi:CPA2 family monovalent cation:H+ antiporter-2